MENKLKNNNKTNGNIDITSATILKGLGEKANVIDLDCCATRLRVTVKDSNIIDKDILKQSGAFGVIIKRNVVQVIYGPKVSVVKSNLEDFMSLPEANNESDNIFENNSENDNDKKALEQNIDNKVEILYSHMNGKIIPLDDVEDDVFSQRILGDGIAVEPSEGKLFAPCDGKIDTVFETKHAVNMVSNNGIEIFMHIGIDTMELKGKFFKSHVVDGQKVKKGDLLVSFDMKKIKKAGYKLTTPLLVCNTDDYASIEPCGNGNISAGDRAIKIII